MNINKTAVITMIVTLMIIGMTGLAMADSTTQTYVGDGSYTTSWTGHGGTMNIDTYTSNGQDHFTADYRRGYTVGTQSGSTNGWTEIDRSVNVRGSKVSISTESYDNSGNLVAIDGSTRRGMVSLQQDVYLVDGIAGYDVTGVVSEHRILSDGRNYDATVYTKAGNAQTVITLDGRYGDGRIAGVAAAGSGYGYSATGQMFEVKSSNHVSWWNYNTGNAIIESGGDYVGIDAKIMNDGTTYIAQAHGMTYIVLDDEYNRYYANGYVYAVDLPNGPV